MLNARLCSTLFKQARVADIRMQNSMLAFNRRSGLISSNFINRQSALTTRNGSIRRYSDKGPAAEGTKAPDAIVLTPYQKVAQTAQGTMTLGAMGLAAVCTYFIVKELLPSRMNPNSLFNEAADQVKANPDVTSRLGTPMRAYGRDHGGHREGRRNFVEHVELSDKAGNKRLRIKFNLQGAYGHAYVFAEVRKGMNTGEWVYLIVQCTRTGEVITIVDNRQILQADSAEEQDALRQLLGNSSSTSSSA